MVHPGRTRVSKGVVDNRVLVSQPPLLLHRYIYCKQDSRIALVGQIISAVGVNNVDIVGVVPISGPVFGPGINYAEPKAAVLKTRIPAVQLDWHAIDGECVGRPKV